MYSVLLRVTLRFVCLILGICSIWILLRGHNSPGGGFIGALVLVLAGVIRMIIDPESSVKRINKRLFRPVVTGVGFLFFGLMVLPLLLGKPYMAALWSKIPLPLAGKLSSVLLFDIGIYLLVSSSLLSAYVAFSLHKGESA